jgi:NAD(P)-dependent dehydrogenase (short-subunit alcohol dehydrogenase family)
MSRLPGTPEAGTEARLRTAVVTGEPLKELAPASQWAFLDLGYNVVANALHFADSTLVPNGNLALVEGNIGRASIAVRVTETAISKFGSIDAVVANAGIFFTKPFTDYTPDDFRRLSETTSRAISTSHNLS